MHDFFMLKIIGPTEPSKTSKTNHNKLLPWQGKTKNFFRGGVEEESSSIPKKLSASVESVSEVFSLKSTSVWIELARWHLAEFAIGRGTLAYRILVQIHTKE